MIMTGYEQALHDPHAVFGEPKQVLADRSLTADQNQAILESWRQDALRLPAPEGVSMAGDGEARHDPHAAFGEPKQVLADRSLTADQKHAILEGWRQDALRLSASEGENMAGGEEAMLQRVCDALRELERQAGARPSSHSASSAARSSAASNGR